MLKRRRLLAYAKPSHGWQQQNNSDHRPSNLGGCNVRLHSRYHVEKRINFNGRMAAVKMQEGTKRTSQMSGHKKRSHCSRSHMGLRLLCKKSHAPFNQRLLRRQERNRTNEQHQQTQPATKSAHLVKRWLLFCGAHTQCCCQTHLDCQYNLSNPSEMSLERWLLCCGAHTQRRHHTHIEC